MFQDADIHAEFITAAEAHGNSGLYIHNTNPNPPINSLLDTYKFGTNMIVHLLTRWEDKLRSAPRL